MASNQEHIENICELRKQLAYLVVPLIPSSARQKFAELMNRLTRESEAVSINRSATSASLAATRRLAWQQRDAYCAFAENLLRTGCQHDAQFFKPYSVAFERLRQELTVEPPTEDELRAQILHRLESELGENALATVDT